jgi:hypothetical protein
MVTSELKHPPFPRDFELRSVASLSRLSLTSKFLSCPEIQHAVECDEQGLCFSHFLIRAIFFKQDVLQIPFALLPKLAGMESTVKAAMLKSLDRQPRRAYAACKVAVPSALRHPSRDLLLSSTTSTQPMGPQCPTPGAGQAPLQPPPPPLFITPVVCR